MGDYAAKELKYKRAATISEDFAFGYEQMSGFQRVFEDNGGKVVKKLWPPLVTPDYTPYIAQIGNVDCVFNGFAGSNPVKFMRAYADLGLKARVPLLAGWTAMDDALLRSLGDEAVGVVSAAWYSADHDTREQQALRRGDAAGLQRAAGRLFGRHVHRRPVRRGRDPEDRRQGRRPQGVCRSAAPGLADRHAARPGQVRPATATSSATCSSASASARASELVNTVVKTYPNVSQFWTYDEKQFLAQPVYARDYPPARNLE